MLVESFRIGTATFIYYESLDPMVEAGVERPSPTALKVTIEID
jgi:hypothetical protein